MLQHRSLRSRPTSSAPSGARLPEAHVQLTAPELRQAGLMLPRALYPLGRKLRAEHGLPLRSCRAKSADPADGTASAARVEPSGVPAPCGSRPRGASDGLCTLFEDTSGYLHSLWTSAFWPLDRQSPSRIAIERMCWVDCSCLTLSFVPRSLLNSGTTRDSATITTVSTDPPFVLRSAVTAAAERGLRPDQPRRAAHPGLLGCLEQALHAGQRRQPLLGRRRELAHPLRGASSSFERLDAAHGQDVGE